MIRQSHSILKLSGVSDTDLKSEGKPGNTVKKNILFEDQHIIVVYKPAGIATQTARVGQQDMVSELKNYLADNSSFKVQKEPYLGIIHRLDQPVSGLLVFGKTKAAASELSRQITLGQMQKYYHAVILGIPANDQGRLEDYLYKDSKANQSLIVKEGFPGAQKAILEYRLIQTLVVLEDDNGFRKYRDYARRLSENRPAALPPNSEISLIEILLLTGRHHQIRTQMAHADMPLMGDSKYGTPASKSLSQKTGCRSVALCASRLVFHHPVTHEELSFEKEPEEGIFLPFFTRGI